MVVTVAKKHETDGDSQPLSMATFFTPAGVRPSDEDMVFRRRAIELGKHFSCDVTCEEAIAEIVKKVISEGLHCTLESIDKEMVKILDSQIGGRSETDLRQG